MNWLLFLICFMFFAVLANDAAADTVTAAIGTALVSNPTYAITIAVICILGIAFFGLLWWAAGSDRAKIKADLLHTPQKPVEPPSVCQQLLDAAAKVDTELKPGTYLTHNDASVSARLKEPTWEIREQYSQGQVKWFIYCISYHVKVCYGQSGRWKVCEEKHVWGQTNGYGNEDNARLGLGEILRLQSEASKLRTVLQFDRKGNPVGEPIKV